MKEGGNADRQKVAKKGVGVNFNSENDVSQMIAWVQGYGSQGSGGGGGGGDAISNADRSSEYDDIGDALNEDIQAGQDTAEELARLRERVGQVSPETWQSWMT